MSNILSGADLQPDAGSYRDPRGRVFIIDDRVFRTVTSVALADYQFVEGTGLFDELIQESKLVDRTVVDRSALGKAGASAELVLQHPLLPFISYPYEWPFQALKAAAVFHLDLQLQSLAKNVMLSDSSAYNVQFDGVRPVFIDHLSFRRYREGEYWDGHRQFCEQFLNPLLLRSKVGIAHNSWYRGSMEGIQSEDLAKALPWRRKLSPRTIMHVLLPATFQARSRGSAGKPAARKSNLPKPALENMLAGLRRWIEKLEPRGSRKTDWGDYAQSHSYSEDEHERKKAFVSRFCSESKPRMLWDIGCNTGDFSAVALTSGAERAIGFDSDQSALDTAFLRARKDALELLPLFLDATNPAPSQGWAEAERAGLSKRINADAVIALALVHHLAITGNVPLEQILDWLTDLAPQGVIEFIPKSDPMVKELLRLREDIFPGYTRENFEDLLGSKTRIQSSETVTETGRHLYWFERQ